MWNSSFLRIQTEIFAFSLRENLDLPQSIMCFRVQVTFCFIFWLNFCKEICEDFFKTRFQTSKTKILNSLSAVKAFRVQYSDPNWAQQELISDLYISQVSALTVGLEMAPGHNVHTCSLTCTGLCCAFFLRATKEIFPRGFGKIFLILNIPKKCMQNS